MEWIYKYQLTYLTMKKNIKQNKDTEEKDDMFCYVPSICRKVTLSYLEVGEFHDTHIDNLISIYLVSTIQKSSLPIHTHILWE